MITQVLSILNPLVFFHLHFAWRDGENRRCENDQYAAKVMDDDCYNKQHMQLAATMALNINLNTISVVVSLSILQDRRINHGGVDTIAGR